MSNIIVPEIIFFNTLKNILKYIRDDYNNASDKLNTILYRSFGDVGGLERYNFFQQLVKILITKEDDPRRFDFALGFNAQKCATPHCHITLPNENSGQNGLGLDQDDDDNIFDESIDEYKKVLVRRFDSAYNFTLTSDNSNEVVVLYHWLRSIMIQLINHLELSRLEHIVISGGDIQLNSSLVPPTIFIRNISLKFSYDLKIQELFSTEFLTKLIFEMDPAVISEQTVDESDSISV